MLTFPSPGPTYSQSNEAAFRTAVRKSLTPLTTTPLPSVGTMIYNLLDFRPDKRIDIGDGTNSAQATFEAAIAGVPAGAALYIPNPTAYYKLTAQLVIDQQIFIYGSGGQIYQSTANQGCFVLDDGADYTEIHGLFLKGPQYASSHSAEKAISTTVASSASPLVGLRFSNLRLEQWWSGVYGQYVQWFEVDQVRAKNMYHSAVFFSSSQYGDIGRVVGRDITAGGNVGEACYCVVVSRPEVDDLSTSPHQTDITIHDCFAYNVPWEAFDTHGGMRIKFRNLESYGTGRCLSIVPGDDNAQNPTYATKDFDVENVHGYSGVTDGSARQGLLVHGAGPSTGTVVDLATGTVRNTSMTGFGDEDGSSSANTAYEFMYTQGLHVVSAKAVEPSRSGMTFFHDNYDFLVDGFTCVDAWGNSTFSAAVACYNGYNTGQLHNVRLVHGSKSATKLNDRGLYVPDTDATEIRYSDCDFRTATTPFSGGSASSAVSVIIPMDVESDGPFTQENVAASQTDVELFRAGCTDARGRFQADRPGSVVGVEVQLTEARTAGTLTVHLWSSNNALHGGAGAQLGTTEVVIDGTHTSKFRSSRTPGLAAFVAGDEVWPTVTTTGSWTPTTADLRVRLIIAYD